MEITIKRTDSPKQKPDWSKLGFGKIFTDHMFECDYDPEHGWHDARVVPFHDLSLSPACMVFHYAQEMFEGLKAYRTEKGEILLFRPDKNIERMNNTNERMCIPKVDPEFALEAIKTVVRTDVDWVPSLPGTSLYIRPFIIATDEFLGVHPSKTYKFIIILSPSGSYYAAGINPVKIAVEDEYVRAVRGGTGFAKVGGNYAASLIGQQKAEENGYAQVLWLDGIYHKYIDEVGAMNVFFKINGEIITPKLEGSILPGVTRRSAIELLRSEGYTVTERRISIDEVSEAHDSGKLEEMFGTGTAAVVSPVGELYWGNKKMTINNFEIGEVSAMLYDKLTSIQWGKSEDKFGWTVRV
ncbi:MAG: branched-chain amino acid aminotransferase [Clostridia bacterium]|nr:branched-chain amino acid aminotransferase [Clostridia bacterium]MBO7400011.1 branched-chain amino acid aminotransferase [Clostridia bacterium]MBP5754672.1 branched-chain amino acid aminotransferase [Clostridia bacterium]